MSAKIFDTNQIGREAKISIRGQRHRCNNPNASDYKYYGRKGVEVKYSSEEFYKWFKKERKKIPLNIKVNVDRINHNKHYSLNNIKLVTKTENIIESNTRRAKVAFKEANTLYSKGYSQKQIGTRFGVSASAIGVLLRKNGVKGKWNK